MNDIAVKIFPIILTFLLGCVLRKTRILNKDNADLFLKLFFYVSFPALILLSIPQIKLSVDLIVLPVIAILIILLTYIIAYALGRFFYLGRPTFGVFLIGAVIMNGGFAFPFIFSAYGEEGMAIASLFDFGNAFLVLSFVYYLACKYGSDDKSSGNLITKFIYSPPLLSLIVAGALNFSKLSLPGFGIEFLKILGSMATPLVMLSLGIYFNHKIVRIWPMLSVLFIRMFVGLVLGIVFIYMFKLQGLSKIVVLIMSSAPVGINTLTYSSMESLDKEFAASIVSYSTLIGMLFIPLLIFLVSIKKIAI